MNIKQKKSESAVANLFSSKNNMKKVPLKSAAGDSEISKNPKPTKLNPLKPLSTGQDQLPSLKPVNTPPSDDAPMPPPVKPKESDDFYIGVARLECEKGNMGYSN